MNNISQKIEYKKSVIKLTKKRGGYLSNIQTSKNTALIYN